MKQPRSHLLTRILFTALLFAPAANSQTAAGVITFAPLPNVSLATAPFTLSATVTSGPPVTFASTTPNVCSVAGNTVTIVASGGCSIVASQPADPSYVSAAPVTQSFTVLFADVPPDAPYYDAVNLLAQKGITAGCGNNGYCPTQNVTRAQMAIFMVRAVEGGDNFTASATPYYTDVPPTYFAFNWIQKLYELGIAIGCGDTTYCPDDPMTRDPMAIFIMRARLGQNLAGAIPTFTYPSTPYFTDVPSTDPAFPWVQRMALESIAPGCGDGTTYCPNDPVTRGDMATFIMRAAFNQLLPAGTPILSQISPAILPVGTSGTFTITGVNTNFVQDTTQLSPLPGVTIGAITVNSATSLTVQLTAAANVKPQPVSVVAITGSEQAVLPNGLLIQ